MTSSSPTAPSCRTSRAASRGGPFQDAWERAGGLALLKDKFEDGGRVGLFGPKVESGWFRDAWAVQNMMEEFPRSGVVSSSAEPVYEQITGIDALNAAGVRLPADIQRDINALMQSGQFHRAGEAAASMLPADERCCRDSSTAACCPASRWCAAAPW